MTTKVLVVCAANICRSPAAEAAVRAAAEEDGVDLEVDSAGTGAWRVGEPPHPLVVAAGARVGLNVTGRARRINTLDFERYDVIAVMDRANLRDVIELAPGLEERAKIRLFRTFDPDTDHDEVPDPYGGPEAGYDTAVAQVVAAAKGLVNTLS